MTQIKEFVNDHFKSVMVIISFLMTMYIQHVNNTNKINELSNKCSTLELKLDDQYKKIDAIKLDKTVFEATMTQFTSMRDDLKEVRSDVKELLKKQTIKLKFMQKKNHNYFVVLFFMLLLRLQIITY